MPPKGYSKKLVAKDMPRPEDVPERLWLVPVQIAQIANARRLGAKGIAALAGVDPSTVSRWMAREDSPSAAALEKLENGLSLGRGELGAAIQETGKSERPKDVLARAVRIGVDPSIVRELLSKDAGEGMKTLSEELRRAVLGAVHLWGHPLETVVVVAKRVAKRDGTKRYRSPETWLSMMKDEPEMKEKPGSGSFPSSSSVKLL